MPADFKYSPEEIERIRNIPMLFIMGKERSGTTLLQTLLDGHPNIVAPPESDFAVMLYPRFGKIKKWTEKDIYNFINELYKEPWIVKIWKIDRERLTSYLLSTKDKIDYSFICKAVYYTMRKDKENILLISDKNPIYVLFINTLLKIFPEAKFIHLVRDPRDNVTSHLKSFQSNNEKFIALKWLAYNNILRKANLRMPEKLHRILYENLCDDTETVMKNLCGFLNIPFNEKMLHNSFPERLQTFGNEQLVLERARQIHGNLLKPVNTFNIGKWKKDLSPEKIRVVEKITIIFAGKNFNYTAGEDTGPISIVTKIKIFKARIIYSCWQAFTRMKYKNYWFNRLYTNFNILIGREKEHFGKIE